MTPIKRGLLLGVANIAVIALGITMWPQYQPRGVLFHQSGAELFLTLLIPGSLAAVPVGIGLGAIADVTGLWPIWIRRLALGAPAVVIVVLCGSAARFEAFNALACIPTVAAVLLLERWTRAGRDAPVARATNLRRRANESSAVANAR